MSDTYDVAAIRNWCGVTHHAGCACHEKRRDEERDQLRAQLEEAKRVIEFYACADFVDGQDGKSACSRWENDGYGNRAREFLERKGE